jgi:hypothetical protein
MVVALSRSPTVILAAWVASSAFALGTTGTELQSRVGHDLSSGRPVVVHVVVALCDNVNQGIVPVSSELGNGRDPRSNLYWGALYGVKTHFSRQGWNSIAVTGTQDRRILERVVYFRTLPREGREVPVYVVADAWDGAEIRPALQAFFAMASGDGILQLSIVRESVTSQIGAGGEAHLVAYVGHNGLMDFKLPRPAPSSDHRRANASIVLACASKPYFLGHLQAAGSHPLLLTTGLMAPEAYTLEAVVRRWVAGGRAAAIRDTAAEAYHRYQHCGLQAAKNLFWVGPDRATTPLTFPITSQGSVFWCENPRYRPVRDSRASGGDAYGSPTREEVRVCPSPRDRSSSEPAREIGSPVGKVEDVGPA